MMKSTSNYRKNLLVFLLPFTILLTGCLDSDDDNEMPTASANVDASATEATMATLTGSGTGDGTLAYKWTQKSGTLAVIDNAMMANASFMAPVLETSENLVFELMVTDEDGETATDEVTVMIDLDSTIAKYKVMVTNITNGQPLTPVAALLHNSAFNPWVIGSAASLGLEMLAESGSPREFLSENVNGNTNVTSGGSTIGDPIGPGASKSVIVGGVASSSYELSIATMLANTNDAFAGVSHWSVGGLSVDETATAYAPVHDAGTEKNTEAAGTIAGPADVSTAADKGFSETRDDPSAFVSLHSGVVTKDDGLAISILNESHRWGGQAAKLVVTRIQ